jgi:hypothetical protein
MAPFHGISLRSNCLPVRNADRPNPSGPRQEGLDLAIQTERVFNMYEWSNFDEIFAAYVSRL